MTTTNKKEWINVLATEIWDMVFLLLVETCAVNDPSSSMHDPTYVILTTSPGQSTIQPEPWTPQKRKHIVARPLDFIAMSGLYKVRVLFQLFLRSTRSFLVWRIYDAGVLSGLTKLLVHYTQGANLPIRIQGHLFNAPGFDFLLGRWSDQPWHKPIHGGREADTHFKEWAKIILRMKSIGIDATIDLAFDLPWRNYRCLRQRCEELFNSKEKGGSILLGDIIVATKPWEPVPDTTFHFLQTWRAITGHEIGDVPLTKSHIRRLRDHGCVLDQKAEQSRME